MSQVDQYYYLHSSRGFRREIKISHLTSDSFSLFYSQHTNDEYFFWNNHGYYNNMPYLTFFIFINNHGYAINICAALFVCFKGNGSCIKEKVWLVNDIPWTNVNISIGWPEAYGRRWTSRFYIYVYIIFTFTVFPYDY